VAVAVAGIFFGTLGQASLIDASVWTHSLTPSDPGVTAARPVRSYNTGDLGGIARPPLVARNAPLPALPSPRLSPALRSRSRIAS
jgi:hypothetical protein